MKHYGLFIASLLLIAGCTSANKKATHKCVAPLESGISIDSLSDCTVATAFNAEDFNWRGDNLSMTLYSEYLYDAVDVSQLQAGDTLIYEEKAMPIDSIQTENGFVIINGGLEQDGACLAAGEGGTYRATTFDDHSVYKEMGKVNVILSEDFVIIDCGENPTDPCDTIRTGQKAYIDKLPETRRDFNPMNTRVRIENGLVKEINRRWIP